jgi:hypothetical protein
MKLGHLNPNSNQRCVVFSILDVSPTLQAAMGTGGGSNAIYTRNIKDK